MPRSPDRALHAARRAPPYSPSPPNSHFKSLKRAFTVNKGLAGVGLARKEWEQIKEAKAGDRLPEWAVDAGGPFEPPFNRCDREEDVAQVYAFFKERLGDA